MTEHEFRPTETIEGTQPRHCLVLTGMMTNDAGINAEYGLKQGFDKVYGAENVIVFNSAISVDTPNPNRYVEMAKIIQDRAREGLDIVAHSLGAEELRRAIKIVKKRQPDFFTQPDVQENLKIIIDSPSGFNKGLKQKIRYGRGMTKLDAPVGVAVDALDAFPMPEVSAQALDPVLADISNLREGFSSAIQEPISNEVYLSDENKVSMGNSAQAVASALETDDPEAALEAFVARGDALKEPLTRAFEGTPAKVEKGKLKLSALGIRTAFRAFGKKALKDFSALSKSGVKIYAKAPQFDFLVPVEMLAYLYENEDQARDHIEIVEKSGHRGFALQSERYARLIHDSGNKDK